ncbi:MAG: ABC transporter ATP-binding protein, partial [Polyangiaceae bacterium]
HQGGWMRPTSEDEKIVDDAIARLELTDLASRPVRELSGGEARRVAIARAFAQTPEILLLDEPGAFLDVRHQISLYERLASEVKENDLACLVVMHDLHMAAQYSHRVALLDAGKLVAIGTPSEVLTEARVREVFGVELATGIDPRSQAPYFVPVRLRHV